MHHSSYRISYTCTLPCVYCIQCIITLLRLIICQALQIQWMKVSMRVTKAYLAEIANVAEASTKLLLIASAMYMLIMINLLIKLNFVILCMWLAHKQWCGTKKCGRFRSSRGWNSALEHRSRVWGSFVGPFSHVAFLLSFVVSSVFKQLVPAHKEHTNLYVLALEHQLISDSS